MKKLIKRLNFAIIGIMASAPAMAAGVNYNNLLCKMATEFNGVFQLLRTLAFIGAGMSIAGWAWGYIEKGKVEITKEVKEKGVGLLVGFILLFSIGTLLSVFMGMAGEGGSLKCVENFFK